MSRADRVAAVVLALSAFLLFNTNGREIASFDSQPTKLAARELLLRGTLGLNHVVGRTPELADRSGFVLAQDGRYRSAYSPVPALLAAWISWPLWKTGALDIRAPRAPNVMAVLAASLLCAVATALVFLTGRRWLTRGSAVVLAIGFAAGTGVWSTASQTLWQHETTIFGFALAVLALTRSTLRPMHGVAIGLGLALAGTSRMQLAPAIAILLIATFVRGGWRAAAPAALITGTAAALLIRVNLLWFGSLFGAAPMLEALHDQVHGVSTSFRLSATGLLGLLVSPNRGLLVFSPIVLVAAWAAGPMRRERWRDPLRWCAIAALAQFLLYGSYTVWWGGHTYGPRYMLDLLPLMVPLAAAGGARLQSRLLKAAAVLALAWSIVVAGTGAFFHPNDRWNTDPTDVDRHHERLWDWSDQQIVRCWQRGTSPQNFNLLTRVAWRN